MLGMQMFWVRKVSSLIFVAALIGAPYQTSAAEPFEINAILSMTGSGAFIGKEEAQSLEVVEALTNKAGGINGRPIKFVVQDDQTNPQVAVQLANGILAKKASILLGSTIVSACNAMEPLLKSSAVLYCFSGGMHPADGSFAYSATMSTHDLLATSARYFSQLGLKKVAFLTSTDATGQDADVGLEASYGEKSPYGTTVVDREHFNPTDLNVTAQITRIKASGAQVLLAWTSGTAAATILRAVSDVGLTIPVLTTAGNLTYVQMKNYGSFMPKELVFAAPPVMAPEQIPPGPVRNAVRAYLDAFAAIGVRPDIGQAIAWDPAMIMVSVFKKIGTDASGEQLHAALSSLRGYVGICGVYDFPAVPQRGVGIANGVMVRWDPAKDTWVGISKFGGAPLK